MSAGRVRVVLRKEYVCADVLHGVLVEFRAAVVESEELRRIDEAVRELMRRRNEKIRRVFNLKESEKIDVDEFGRLCVYEESGEGVMGLVRCLRRSEVKKYREIVEEYGEEVRELEEKKVEILRSIAEALSKKIPDRITLEM